MWKLSHTDVCDCGERQTMSHLMTCGDAPNCTWTDLAFFQPLPVSTVPNTGRNQSDSGYRGLDEEDFYIIYFHFFSVDHGIPQTFGEILTT